MDDRGRWIKDTITYGRLTLALICILNLLMELLLEWICVMDCATLLIYVNWFEYMYCICINSFIFRSTRREAYRGVPVIITSG